ncbi:MAG TPA: 2-C-methyl-D-erythritol 4-phosphate cytidylyltransferase [Chloroflexota bacterium]|nr:2-C-methyl-D-erythritol 4-phosphate cytidylyltransferase [Chloroflexota bacterium]
MADPSKPAVLTWGPHDLSHESLRALTRAALQGSGKAVLVTPVFDTIKRVEDGLVQETIDRDRLRWPVAWACIPSLKPPTDPPPAQWFEGAVEVRER